jgi:hypothetical protein
VNKNPLYSISLGVASLQDDSVGVVTALSPATVGHFKFYLLSSIVGLGLIPSSPVVARKLAAETEKRGRSIEFPL